MEQFVNGRECAGLRTIVGFLLFCIYSCSRFGEAAKGSNADLDFQTAKETLLIELTLRNYTATGDRRGVLLPLIALGNGLYYWSWGMAWRQARIDSGAAAGNFVKSGTVTVPERLWLGHQQNEEGKMAISYARDALVSVLIKLKRIVNSIRDGHFDSDLSRVERVMYPNSHLWRRRMMQSSFWSRSLMVTIQTANGQVIFVAEASVVWLSAYFEGGR